MARNPGTEKMLTNKNTVTVSIHNVNRMISLIHWKLSLIKLHQSFICHFIYPSIYSLKHDISIDQLIDVLLDSFSYVLFYSFLFVLKTLFRLCVR